MASPFFDPCGFPMFLGGKPPEPPSALVSAHAAPLNERVWSLTKDLSAVGAPEAAKAKNIDYDSLYISGLNLKSITAPLNPNLKYLNCSDNQLTYLPVLPPTLVHLNCSGNNLTSLPKLPDTLILLDVTYK
jgi:Leucine-rich repeat (LRR) protein